MPWPLFRTAPLPTPAKFLVRSELQYSGTPTHASASLGQTPFTQQWKKTFELT